MSKRMLLVLIAAAVILVGLAIIGVRESAPEANTAQPGPLLPSLAARINKTARIRLEKAHGGSVTLKKTAGGWVVPERYDYPADFGKIRSLLLELTQARRIEAETNKPAHYHYLRVQNIKASGALGTLVALDSKSGKPVARLIVGKPSGQGGTYVRIPGQRQSWLAKGISAPPVVKPGHWLNKKLIDVSADKIEQIHVAPTSGSAFTLTRTKRGGAFTLTEPAGKTLGKSAKVNVLSSALSDLTFSRVEPAKSAAIEKPEIVDYRTFGGWNIALKAEPRKSGRVLTHWDVSFDRKLALRFAKSKTRQGGKSKRLAKDRVKALALAQRLSAWDYVLPSYTANDFQVTLNDLTAGKGRKHQAN